ncbi:hypothetical protein [Christiangramia fulva]|nr:hypothetical protein [Christiangramia fulva]
MMRNRGSLSLMDGMSLDQLKKETSTSFINTLRENDLIVVSRNSEVYLTDRGQLARKMGIENFMNLENAEKELLSQELRRLRIENRGLLMVFIGLMISLVFIISFWALHLEV